MARLLSVNVGLPREILWRGQTVYTSVWKEPIQGRRLARRLNIDGDAQGYLAGHGGEQRAVFVYQMDSYRYWERELQRHDFTFGQFGENFTVEGLADSEVCIGDRYRIGGALFEVTQPRVTCYRVGIRMDDPRIPALLVKHRRPGFYFRMLEEGEVGAGDEIIKVAEGPERLTVAAVDAGRRIQKDLDITEYTDPLHNPMIPYTIVLETGLVIYKIYMGYWFFGRPTLEELRQDLRAVLSKCRPDWDITTPELKAAWQEDRKELFYPYGKTYAQTLAGLEMDLKEQMATLESSGTVSAEHCAA